MRLKTQRSIIAIAVAQALISEAAWSQQTAAPAGAELEEVIVYGQALSIERAIETKRVSDAIIDVTAQDDIGRLPDLNTAAAVRRLPGLAVQNDQGEARFPILRGLNATYNRTTIDGSIVASPERGGLSRAVPLDLIPAALLARIEAQKSITPDLDHNAIGGTINLVTRSAFEAGEPFAFGSAFLGNHEQTASGTTLDEGDSVTPWRAGFAAGTLFGDNEQFGAVIGFDYSIRNFEIPQIEVDDADYTEFDAAGNNVGLGNGNGIVVPTNQRIFFYNNVRERIGTTARFEWRPSDRLAMELAGSYNEYNDSERRDEQRYELGTGTGSNQPAVIRQQTPTAGITDTGFNIIGIGRFVLDRDIWAVRAGLDFDLTDNVLLEVDGTYTAAELDNPEVSESFQTGSGFGARYDTSTFFNTVSPLDPGAFFDPRSYAHVNRGQLDRFAEDDTVELRADLTFREFFARDFELKAGLLYRNIDKEEGFNFRRFVAAEGVDYTLADVADPQLADVAFQGGYRFRNRIGLEAADAFFDQNAFNEVLNIDRGASAEEEVTAGYLMGTWRADRFALIGGLRVEYTDWSGAPLGGDTVEGDYTDVLPSAVLTYDLADDLKLRVAASQTLGRPDVNQLTRGVDINLTEETISRSNPELEPRRSTNLDLSIEWYIENGILAAGLFYKDIADEIFFLTTQGPVTIDGVTYDQVSQPENAADAEITGLELQYQQAFRFLPAPFDGFGVQANMTYLDTEYTVPLGDGTTRQTAFFQQPELVYNLTGFYVTPAFELRVSYNYTDRFLDALNAGNPNRDEFWDERTQVDMQARFNLTSKLSVIGEVQNLTDEGRRELTGPGAVFLQEDAEFGRTFWLGVNAQF